MRQPNRSLPGVSRPVEVLWPNLYNRAALDVTSTLPLSISLTNLRPMIFSLPQLRQAMTEDGGLESLIDIMSTVRRPNDPNEVPVRKLALQCLTQFGIRGPESIRLRTVEAQIVPALVTMLECFWRAMEQDIRDCITFGLQPPPPPRPVSGPRPLQMLTRRRAITIGSTSAPAEGLGGLQIRFTTNRSPLSRLSPIIRIDPSESVPSQRRIDDGVVVENIERDQRMDVDSHAPHDAEEEVITEDTMIDGEALRSPPPEEDVFYTSSFTAGQNQDASGDILADSSPPSNTVQAMDIDDSHDSVVSQAHPLVSEQSISTIQMPPSSPGPVSNHLPIPPNAPILPYAVPPMHSSNASLDGVRPPTAPSRRISALHTNAAPQDWRIPRSEDILECLETLAYLSKYPKLRAYFNSTHFTASILQDWQTPEDATKEVNVFEIVERFTFTKYHPENVCFWASIVMRHYSRKDDVVTKRQCGNLQCRKWEADEPGMKFICCPKCKYFLMRIPLI
jgi:hypothetical protein